jgi:large subunit ribosomal protein L7/L12
VSTQQKIETLRDELSKLTVLEMSELKTLLEETWGVKAAAAAPVFAAGPAAAAAPVEESTDFEITLKEVPADKKIGVIKVIRETMNLGLKEAKDMAEAAPKVLKDSAPKAEAEEMKKKLEAAGAQVVLKGL